MTKFFAQLKNAAKQAFPTEMNVVKGLAFIHFMAEQVHAQASANPAVSSSGSAQDSAGPNWFYNDTNGMIAFGVSTLILVGLYFCSQPRTLPPERTALLDEPRSVPPLAAIDITLPTRFSAVAHDAQSDSSDDEEVVFHDAQEYKEPTQACP